MDKLSNIMRELFVIQGAIGGVYHEAALKLGLTDTEMDILSLLAMEGEGCNQTALYQKTATSKSTVNTALHKMRAKGLLSIETSGRITRVYLTEEGREFSGATVERLMRMEDELFNAWTSEERETFLRLNQRYLDDLRERVKAL